MRTLTWCLASFLSVLVAPAAMAQDRVMGRFEPCPGRPFSSLWSK
jgi:hypothetical protein